jgi:hypothetical protein
MERSKSPLGTVVGYGYQSLNNEDGDVQTVPFLGWDEVQLGGHDWLPGVGVNDKLDIADILGTALRFREALDELKPVTTSDLLDD